jgi:predicted NBD/HSP70 family sugar kinase
LPAVTFTTGGALNKSALREANERLVLNAIRQNPRASRSDLARITGLSRSSVTFIVNRLVRNKVICEERMVNHSQVGRRPTPLRLRADAMMAAGVEIGLSGARVALADLTGNMVRHKTVAWHPNQDLFLDKIHAAIRGIIEPLSPQQVLGVGVGLPGFLDRATGKVIAAENFNWFGVEAGNLLRKKLACPFYFENSARLSALAEMWFSDRDRKPLRDFVFVTMRGGLGTGVMISGQILRGASSGAAEFGHTTLYAGGRRCPCGNTGCWEQYASDLALRRRYAERCREAGQDPVVAEPEAIIGKAREGEPVALRVLRETAHDAGMGFVNLIMALNPEAIIVGDYLAEGWDLVEDIVWAEVRKRVPAYYLTGVRILPSKHALDSSLLGAVALVFAQFFTTFDQGNGNLAAGGVVMRPSV